MQPKPKNKKEQQQKDKKFYDGARQKAMKVKVKKYATSSEE